MRGRSGWPVWAVTPPSTGIGAPVRLAAPAEQDAVAAGARIALARGR